MQRNYKKKREQTTSSSVGQGVPMAFNKPERARRRKELAAEMAFLGIAGSVLVDHNRFDRLAVVWDSIRENLGVWGSRITKQARSKYRGVPAFEWTGEIRSKGSTLVVDFKTPKHESCLTPWIMRAVLEYSPAADTFEGSFYMINGHGKAIVEQSSQFGREVMGSGPALAMTASQPSASLRKVSTSMAMDIVHGKSAKAAVIGHEL